MTAAPAPSDRRLKILHVFRAPLGGLFRHVVDLTREQAARGHEVGLFCDSTTGGDSADRTLAELAPLLTLGLIRTPMSRKPGFGDIQAQIRLLAAAGKLKPDVIHGHGSKGGLYARLPGLWSRSAIRAYTPHGGSFNYRPGSFEHRVYMSTERLLKRGTDIFLFESAFIADRFRDWAGDPGAMTRVVWNGIGDAEFAPVERRPDAVDFLYIGELRAAKGIDTLIDALAEIDRTTALRPKAVLVGTGPDLEHLIEQVAQRGLSERVAFLGSLRAREAFGRARIMVTPSRAESLPYVVLEAAGARVPIVSTDVGGIPEIFGPFRDRLIPCDDPIGMARALVRALNETPDERAEKASQLAEFVASRFTTNHMVDAVLNGYRDALVDRAATRLSPATRIVST